MSGACDALSTTMIKVTAYTGGRTVPSARFRVRQYLGELPRHGLLMREISSMTGAYPPASRFLRPFWGIGNLGEHLVSTMASYRTDVAFLQREFLSTFYTLERFLKKPIVLDVDDAIWLYREGRCARDLARLSEKIVCGNAFLADWFSRWNQHVDVISTPVDTEYFKPDGAKKQPGKFRILWSGSSSNLQHLYDIEDALCAVLATHEAAVLRVVCDRSPGFSRIPVSQLEFFEWNEADEVRLIQECDVGLMPLGDTEWEKGKCSFKMLMYMACGLPVVASNVGMNVEVLRRGNVGFGVDTRDDWVGAIEQLMIQPSLCESIGQDGRKVAETHYSVKVNAKRLGDVIRSVVEA